MRRPPALPVADPRCYAQLDSWCNTPAAGCHPSTHGAKPPQHLVAVQNLSARKWMCWASHTSANDVQASSNCSRTSQLRHEHRACLQVLNTSTCKIVEPTHHSSCALVASSSALLQRDLGRAIDQHEAVFRFNDAPTEQLEAHVGRRTSYRVVNYACSTMLANIFSAERRNAARDTNARCHRILSIAPVEVAQGSKFLSFYFTADAVCEKMRYRIFRSSNYLTTPSTLLSGAFLRVATVLSRGWSEHVLQACNRTGTLLTGTGALLMALRMCSNITLFGFSDWSSSDADCEALNASCSPTKVSVEEVAYHYYGGLVGDRRPDQAHHLACDGALLQHAVKYAGKRLVMLP